MKKILITIFDIIFVITMILFIKWTNPSNIISYAIIVLYVILILVIYNKMQKYKIKNYMFTIIFIIILILQIISARLFKVIPTWDFGAVYKEAINDSFNINNMDYFCTYPNNIPTMFLLKTIIHICKFFNINNNINIGIGLNIIAIDLSIIILTLVVKEIKGKEKAFFTLLFISIMPVIYLAVPIFYTDTLSMPFPIMLIYIYLKFKKEEEIIKKILYSIALGITAILGANIKITVFIAFIAILIYELLTYKKQELKNILYIILSLVTILLLIFIEMTIFRFKFEDLEKLKNSRLPFTHYIMMSLGTYGNYNPKDVEFTTSFESREEKINANIEEIKHRMEKYNTFNQMIKNIQIKEMQIWNDGTYYMPSLLKKYHVNEGKMQNLIYENNEAYIWISQLQRKALILLMLIASFYKKGEDEEINVICRISIFGLIVFFSFWEVNSRYIINYIPIFTLIEILGIDITNNIFERVREKIIAKYKKMC